MTNVCVLAILLSAPAAPPAPTPAKTDKPVQAEKPTKVDKPDKAGAGDLTVTVTNVDGKKGKVVIAVYQKAVGFPNDFAKAWKVETVDAATPTFTFADLPPGKYAVIAFHDRNGNGRLDQIPPFGIPAEPIAVSNYPKMSPQTGLPRFDKARVAVAGATAVEVKLVEFGK